jgi:hypothetical protein
MAPLLKITCGEAAMDFGRFPAVLRCAPASGMTMAFSGFRLSLRSAKLRRYYDAF